MLTETAQVQDRGQAQRSVDLGALSKRARVAAANGEAAEVVSALIHDVYAHMRTHGLADDPATRAVFDSYCAVRMMHGMRDARRGWWDKLRNGKKTDFRPVIDAYRNGQN